MLKISIQFALLAALVALGQSASSGRGFGGGGGGFHGGGGFGGGGFGGGGFHGGDFGGGGYGGFHGYGSGGFGGGDLGHGGYGGLSGGNFSRDGLGADALSREGFGGGVNDWGRGQSGDGGFGGGDWGGDGRGLGAGAYDAAPSRGQLNNFLGLPSDEGMHNMVTNPFVHGAGAGGGNIGGDGGINTQHGTWHGPEGGFAAGGSAEGPRGGEAGHGVYVGPNGTVVAGGGAKGPNGGEAGHGVVVGPNGRVAGGGAIHGPNGGTAARGFAAGPNGWAAGFARVSPSQRYATAGFVRGNWNHWNYFDPGWYGDHPGAWFCAGWAAGRYWWPCAWPVLYDWFDFPSEYPVYYDYGNTVVYQDNGVYVDGVDQGTPQEYYQQAQTLADNGADADAPSQDGGDWLSLGVFLLTKPGEKDSHDVFQLAINKQGVLRGNFQDSANNVTESVQGSADLKTQRVAFTVGDKKSTVIETGLYNLTKDEAPALIHFGADRTEQWLLVRLKNPDASPAGSVDSSTSSAASTAPATTSTQAPVNQPL